MRPGLENKVHASRGKLGRLPSLYAGIMSKIDAMQAPEDARIEEIDRMVDRFFNISAETLNYDKLTLEELEQLERFHISIESGLKRKNMGRSGTKKHSDPEKRVHAMRAASMFKGHSHNPQKSETPEQQHKNESEPSKNRGWDTNDKQSHYMQIKTAIKKSHEFRKAFKQINGSEHNSTARKDIYEYCMEKLSPEERIEKAREIANFIHRFPAVHEYMDAIAATGNVEVLTSKKIMDFAMEVRDNVSQTAAENYFKAIATTREVDELTSREVTASVPKLSGFTQREYFNALLHTGDVKDLTDERLFSLVSDLPEYLATDYFRAVASYPDGAIIVGRGVVEFALKLPKSAKLGYVEVLKSDRGSRPYISKLADDHVIKNKDVANLIQNWRIRNSEYNQYEGKSYFDAIAATGDLSRLTSRAIIDFALQFDDGDPKDAYFKAIASTRNSKTLTDDSVIRNERVLNFVHHSFSGTAKSYFQAIGSVDDTEALTSQHMMDFVSELDNTAVGGYFKAMRDRKAFKILTDQRITSNPGVLKLLSTPWDTYLYFNLILSTGKIDTLTGKELVDRVLKLDADVRAQPHWNAPIGYFEALDRTKEVETLTRKDVMDFIGRIGKSAHKYFNALIESGVVELTDASFLEDANTRIPMLKASEGYAKGYFSFVGKNKNYRDILGMSELLKVDLGFEDWSDDDINLVNAFLGTVGGCKRKDFETVLFHGLDLAEERGIINAIGRLLRYFPNGLLSQHDLQYIAQHKLEFSELSKSSALGFVPVKSVLEAYVNGGERKRSEIKDKIRGNKHFDMSNRLDLAIEYGKIMLHIKQTAKEANLTCTFEEFEGRIKNLSAGLADAPQLRDEMRYGAYEVSRLNDTVLRIKKLSGRADVIGNMRLGAVYSESMRELDKGVPGLYFSLSRVGSGEMHESDYLLKSELILDKTILRDLALRSKPLFILDASAHQRMPDAFKAYRSYFAALDILRLGLGKPELPQAILEDISERMDIPMETLSMISAEVASPLSNFRDALGAWFLMGREHIKPFRIFEYDMAESGKYRVSREIQGEGRKREIENELPSEEDLRNFNCVVLMQASIPDNLIPTSVKDALKVSSAHTKAYFDDRTNLLSAQFYYDETGVHLRPNVSHTLAEEAIRMHS